MNGLKAVFRRELAAYFETPLAWVFLTVFALAAPSFAWRVGDLFDTGRADLAPLFDFMPWLLLVLMPALAMRAWAEERDRGTLETLLSAPIPLWASALGKFLAAWAVAGLAIALTFPMWIAMNYLGEPDNAATATAYFGALLLAGGYLALGQALSAATSNQVIAFVLGAAACFLITVAGLPFVLDALSARLPGAAAEALAELSALARFESLRRGVVSLSDVVYFLSLIGLGLGLAMTLIDSRRGGGR
ncbi:MAG: ABC transporter permease [Oceanicaulis sp.]